MHFVKYRVQSRWRFHSQSAWVKKSLVHGGVIVDAYVRVTEEVTPGPF